MIHVRFVKSSSTTEQAVSGSVDIFSPTFTHIFPSRQAMTRSFLLCVIAFIATTVSVSAFVPQQNKAFLPRITTTKVEAAPTMVIY
jgi:hypothetical protein